MEGVSGRPKIARIRLARLELDILLSAVAVKVGEAVNIASTNSAAVEGSVSTIVSSTAAVADASAAAISTRTSADASRSKSAMVTIAAAAASVSASSRDEAASDGAASMRDGAAPSGSVLISLAGGAGGAGGAGAGPGAPTSGAAVIVSIIVVWDVMPPEVPRTVTDANSIAAVGVAVKNRVELTVPSGGGVTVVSPNSAVTPVGNAPTIVNVTGALNPAIDVMVISVWAVPPCCSVTAAGSAVRVNGPVTVKFTGEDMNVEPFTFTDAVSV